MEITDIITDKINKVLSSEPKSLSNKQLDDLSDALKYAIIESGTRNDKKGSWGKLTEQMTDLMDGYSDYNKAVHESVKDLISTISSYADVFKGVTDINKLIGKDLFKDSAHLNETGANKYTKKFYLNEMKRIEDALD